MYVSLWSFDALMVLFFIVIKTFLCSVLAEWWIFAAKFCPKSYSESSVSRQCWDCCGWGHDFSKNQHDPELYVHLETRSEPAAISQIVQSSICLFRSYDYLMFLLLIYHFHDLWSYSYTMWTILTFFLKLMSLIVPWIW